MVHADKWKRTQVFFWDWKGGRVTINGRTGEWNSVDQNGVDFAVSAIDGDVPLEGWKSLALAFLTDFDRE